ncbi:MAG TPA: isoprenylcysteine carboxylmethyltransferase family protein [Burkholderiales bacterium]|nr:isoprenylcysteine carboxylmethyltransferase family protein [Burkholderiales bacterium]
MAIGLENRVPPPIVAACFAAAMLALAWVAPALTFPIPSAFALAVALVGVSLDAIALIHFLRSRTTVNPLKPDSASALVTGGIYRLTRNPMYLGLAALLLAWAIYLGNLAALAGLPLFILYMNRFQIAPEERALEARFGAEYIAYRSRVRRWV